MPGPGGREAGRVSIRVLPDTSVFARSLKRYLTRVEKTLKVEIPTSLDDTGAVAQAEKLRAKIKRKPVNLHTQADTRKAQAQIARIARDRKTTINVGIDGRALSKALKTVSKISAVVGAIALAGYSVAGALTVASQAAAALLVPLLQASGALVALGPAALGAAAVVGGTLALAFAGLEDSSVRAVKQMRKAVKDLAPAFKRLQELVRGELFEGWGAEIRRVAISYLPTLRAGLSGIAGELNLIGRQFAATLDSPQSLHDTAVGFTNVEIAISKARGVASNLTSALRDIAVVGSSFLPGMAASVDTLARRFANFIAQARRTGELKAFIERGLGALKQLGAIGKDIGGIFNAVFKALRTSGQGALGIIGKVLDKVNEFLNGVEGQQALVNIFTSLGIIGRTLGPIFSDLTRAFGELAPHVASIVRALGPAFRAVIKGVSSGLKAAMPGIQKFAEAFGEAFEAFAPALEPLGRALGKILDALSPILPLIGKLAEIFAEVLAGALEAIAPSLEVMAKALAENLAPVLPKIAEAFGRIAEALEPVAEMLAEAFVTAVEALVPMMPDFAKALAEIAVALADMFKELAPVLPSLIKLATVIFTRAVLTTIQFTAEALKAVANVMETLGNVMEAPIGALADFMDKISEIAGNLPSFSDVVETNWQGIQTSTRQIWQGISSFIKAQWEGIKLAVRTAVQGVKSFLSAQWQGIARGASTGWQLVVGFIGAQLTGMKLAVTLAIQGVVGFFSALPGKVVSALGNLGRTLYNSGRELIRGFINGIKSMISSIANAAKQAVAAAGNFFPHSPAKKGPFSGKGWTLYSGMAIGEALAEGMRRRATLVQSAAAQLTSAASPSLAGVGNAALAAGDAGSMGGDTYNFYGRDVDINELTIGALMRAERLRARVGRRR